MLRYLYLHFTLPEMYPRLIIYEINSLVPPERLALLHMLAGFCFFYATSLFKTTFEDTYYLHDVIEPVFVTFCEAK